MNGYVSVPLARYLKHRAENGKQEPEKFLFKDVRRTCKQIMVDAGIPRDSRNLLQHHALTGIDYRHYDHSDHLPEKREALRIYDAYLAKVLNGQDSNVVLIKEVKH